MSNQQVSTSNTSGRRSRVGNTLLAAALVVGGAFAASAAQASATTVGWAKVASNGSLLATSGISKVIQFGNGRYDLTTTFNSSACSLTGSVNTAGGNDPGPGSASILLGSVNSKTVFVRTATPSSSGSAVVDDSRPFSILIICH